MKKRPDDEVPFNPKTSMKGGGEIEKEDAGYGKPPTKNRFRKGTSGNPKGRPKARRKPSLNLATIFNEVFSAPVQVIKNGRKQSMPALEAIFWNLSSQMSKGDLRAMRAFLPYHKAFGGSLVRTDKLGELRAALEFGPMEPGTRHKVEDDDDEDD